MQLAIRVTPEHIFDSLNNRAVKMNLVKLLSLGALLIASVSVSKAATITATDLGNLTQMPGSPTDYSFLGKDGQFGPFGYGGGSPDTGVQTHFTMTTLVGESYGGDGRYSVIKNPLGVSTQTGILFGRAGNVNQNLLQLNLGHAKFNYGDFNLFVMFGNGSGDGQVRDTALTVTDVTKGVALTFSVSDTNTSPADLGVASFAEFHIVGASSGDVLQIGATSPPFLNYIGGVSLLAEVPEPSTYALMLGGFVFLVFMAVRRSRKNLV
jgi:hypothetical protein